MILIADSGSTVTSWYYINKEENSEIILTKGINPFFRTTKDIFDELQNHLLPKINSFVSEIYFYGAGVINQEKAKVIKEALHSLFKKSKIEIHSDLLAAARATCGNRMGISCILGTGSNSGLFNGNKIVEQVSPLGFILGDEGSGAVLGRKLVGDYLKGLLPEHLTQKFRKQYSYNYFELMDRIYKKEKPNKFLAQFVPFLSENIADVYCNQLVLNSFEEFINRNVKQYTNFTDLKIHFVGSVSYYFQAQLKQVINKNNLKMGEILKDPLENLVRFHLNK